MGSRRAAGFVRSSPPENRAVIRDRWGRLRAERAWSPRSTSSSGWPEVEIGTRGLRSGMSPTPGLEGGQDRARRHFGHRAPPRRPRSLCRIRSFFHPRAALSARLEPLWPQLGKSLRGMVGGATSGSEREDRVDVSGPRARGHRPSAVHLEPLRRAAIDGYEQRPGMVPIRLDASLPVSFGIRSSLSYPGLLSAFRLFEPDGRERAAPSGGASRGPGTPLREVWLSDGGIAKNSPVDLYDYWVPQRMTYAIDLEDAELAQKLRNMPEDAEVLCSAPTPRTIKSTRSLSCGPSSGFRTFSGRSSRSPEITPTRRRSGAPGCGSACVACIFGTRKAGSTPTCGGRRSRACWPVGRRLGPQDFGSAVPSRSIRPRSSGANGRMRSMRARRSASPMSPPRLRT